MAQIAIIGGGPAGAVCGEQLARAGHQVNLYDEHLAWEKPCGGGLTHKAIQCFPFLLDNSYPKKLVHSVELISSQEHRATLEMQHPIVIYSRKVLNGLLLDRAQAAGCRVQRSRVLSVDIDGTKPRFSVEGEWHETDFLVLAAGARNQLVPGSRALQRDELEMTQGYFVPQNADPSPSNSCRNLKATSGRSRAAIISLSESAAACPRIPARSFAGTCKRLSRSRRFQRKAQSSTATSCPRRKSARSRNATLSARTGRWSATPPPGSIRSPGKACSTQSAPASFLAVRWRKAARRNIRRGSRRHSRPSSNLPPASSAVSIADLFSETP